MTDKIYFLSTGRTGTSFLYNLFNTYYPELNITHQTKWSRIINILGNLPLHTKKHHALLKRCFKILKNNSIPESTVDPLRSVPIKILIDNGSIKHYKIIHIVRHPATFVESFTNWKNQSSKRIILHHIIPFWQPSPLFENNMGFFKWLKMSKFEHFCWIWNYKNSLFSSNLESCNNYLRVKSEDLSKKETVEKIIGFLNLPYKKIDLKFLSENQINASAKKKNMHFSEWNDKKIKILKKHCQSLMNEYSYSIT